MTIIDIHPHIVSDDTARYPITPLGGTRSEWSHERSVTGDELIVAMDAAGVDKAAVVHSSTTYGFNCEYLADVIAKYPDRLTGVCSVNVLEPDALEALDRWVERGFTGTRLYLQGSTIKESILAMNDPRIFPTYEYAAEHGLSVASNVKAQNFPELVDVLERFPTVNFILDHMGRVKFDDGAPFEAARPLWELASYPNLYVKIVSGKFRDAHDGKSTPESKFKRLVAEFGADRCAWGSNYPSATGTLPELMQLAKEGLSSLPQEDQDWILGGTAMKLYPALA